MFKKIVLLIALVVSMNASYTNISDLSVNQISLYSDTGLTHIQFSPKPSLEGLQCTDNYWTILDSTKPGYKEVLSLLTTAHVTGSKKVFVSLTDDGKGSQFCRIYRIVLMK